MKDYLRYYLCSLTVLAGIGGFIAGGWWMGAGLGTFVVLVVAAQAPPVDHGARRFRHRLLADLPLDLHGAAEQPSVQPNVVVGGSIARRHACAAVRPTLSRRGKCRIPDVSLLGSRGGLLTAREALREVLG